MTQGAELELGLGIKGADLNTAPWIPLTRHFYTYYTVPAPAPGYCKVGRAVY
jgi:hypothetical protein